MFSNHTSSKVPVATQSKGKSNRKLCLGMHTQFQLQKRNKKPMPASNANMCKPSFLPVFGSQSADLEMQWSKNSEIRSTRKVINRQGSN